MVGFRSHPRPGVLSGFVLTVAPLMQEGTSFRRALVDAFYSESASITVMELSALAVDFLLGGSTNLAQPLFWISMVLSLSCGLLAAYPGSTVEAEAMLLLGEVYMETDETGAAQDTLKEVIQRFPGTGEAKRARTLLRKLS